MSKELGWVGLNKDGHYLVISERTGHGCRPQNVCTWVKDINKASVMGKGLFSTRVGSDDGLIAIVPAVETKVVTLEKTDGKVGGFS